MVEATIAVLSLIVGIVLERYFRWRDQTQEAERQKRSLARAFLIEIDDFYRYFLRDVRKSLRELNRNELPAAKSVGAKPFPVFHGNSGRLGDLDNDTAESIVHFYSAAESYLATFRDYKTSRDCAGNLEGMALLDAHAEASALLNQIRDTLPELVRLTWLVCHNLAEVGVVPFHAPSVAVAAEKLTPQDFHGS